MDTRRSTKRTHRFSLDETIHGAPAMNNINTVTEMDLNVVCSH